MSTGYQNNALSQTATSESNIFLAYFKFQELKKLNIKLDKRLKKSMNFQSKTNIFQLNFTLNAANVPEFQATTAVRPFVAFLSSLVSSSGGEGFLIARCLETIEKLAHRLT